MEAGSILLEHTLVLAGESVDANFVWQGWPSNVQISLETYLENQEFQLSFFAGRNNQNNFGYQALSNSVEITDANTSGFRKNIGSEFDETESLVKSSNYLYGSLNS